MNWQSSVVDPVLHVVVVGFHHKKGCQVEYAYPPLIEGNDVASHECPKKWKHLPSLALPDGAHNFSEDTIYFHLPSLDNSETTIFGVSCCQQIDASEVLNKGTDVTRNTVQKSVCVLSRLPVFGLIQVKLEMITQAYFKGRDFSQVELLEDTHKTLNSSLTECLLQNSHIHLGLSGRDLLKQFRHKLVILFKLFLLEKKVLFYSSPVKPICMSILAIVSLFPGLIEQGLFESAQFDAVQTSPTIELNPPLLKSSKDQKQPEGRLNLDVGNLDVARGDSTTTPSNMNSNNLASSLGQLSQQKWHSVTFSQLRSKFFSSFKVNNESSTAHPLITTSLPAIPLSTCPDVEGRSTFYNGMSSMDSGGKMSDSSKNNSADPCTSVANSTFFITPQTTTMESEQNKIDVAASPDPNQAPIHLSRQNSIPEKPRAQSENVDKNILEEEFSEMSSPSNFEVKQEKLRATSARDFHGDSICQTSAINNEDMLVDDDDDDIIFKEGTHRLEINEFNTEIIEVGVELISEEKISGRSTEASQTELDQSVFPPKFIPNSISPSSFTVGSDHFGLPLMIFTKGILCHPYLSLHLYDLLTDPGVSGFTIGATNALFKQRRQLLDVIVELSESRIDIIDVELRKQLTLSTADLRFADTLVRGLAKESGDPFLDNTGWEGGDDWIRSQFRSYLMSLLSTVHYGDEKAEEDFNSLFIEAWKSTHNYKTWVEGGPYEALSSIPPQHLCKGNLTMSDFKLKINQVINNGSKERRITSVVNQTVTQTGKAVEAAVNMAKSTVSNWFGGFASKD